MNDSAILEYGMKHQQGLCLTGGRFPSNDRCDQVICTVCPINANCPYQRVEAENAFFKLHTNGVNSFN
ncbi:MAG: hypothetical protein Q8Q23_06555 [bacterium]|nr:hypothetical protein [bacterium]